MRPGDVVADRFEILHVAGSGGMGVVHRAHDRETGRPVALKVLVQHDQAPSERFAQEVELLSALDHPHIVGYVSHGLTAAGAPYLVMPWLDGIDLQEKLRAGPLSIEDTLTVARQVADALACLHERGLVHRDLKPSNLFLPGGKVENVQVIDLGIARATIPTRPLTLSGVLVGTPGFMAPEQARGDHEVAPAVDIFALGCVLFECLTGTRLFGGTHMMAVLAKILLEEAPRVRELRPDVPNALDLLVHRMVAKDPDKRPKDGAELGRWLADLGAISGLETMARPNALGPSERRVVTVLVVVLPLARGSAPPTGDETRVEADPLRSSAARFGVRLELLADRTAVVLAPAGVSAADQASVLARFAGYVAEAFPGAHVAISTGSAVTGARLPVGEAIDRGVSLVRSAPTTQGVHVDDVTAALITSRFDIRREQGRLVLGDERLSLDPTRPLLGRPTSCVGRERELAILDGTFLECVEAHMPKAVLVTAPAGAGKSRLRHELVRRLYAKAQPPHVLLSRGDPLHVATPYAIAAQVVRQAAGLRDREAPERAREKLARHVASLLPENDRERATDFLGELLGASFPDEGRVALRAARQSAAAMADQIRLAFEEVVRAWCKRSPTIVVLEDLQWADPASVRLVDGALRKLAGAPLFVLALARPEVHERFPALFKHRDLVEVRLPPLAPRACTKLVREVMGEEAQHAEVERIAQRSEGNAFYLEELIRAAAERARRKSTPPPPLPRREELPETVIAVAQARLERLEPSVRKVLRAASVFGDVFWLEAVAALVGEEPTALAPIVDALVEHEAIAPSEHPRLEGMRELVFRHALLRSAAYETLTEEDRALGHRLAAQWLDRVDEDGEVVALHWLDAGDGARAADSFARAAEARWRRAQPDAAARCAVRALLVGDGKDDLGARVRLLADALEVTRRIDARDVLTGLERHVTLRDEARGTVAHAALEPALDVLRANEDPRRVAVVLGHAARALASLSDMAAAKRLIAEATSMAGDDETAHHRVRYASAKVAYVAGDWRAAVEILSIALLPDDPRERLELLLILAMCTVAVGGRDARSHGLDFASRAEALIDPGDPVAQVHCAKARFFCHYFAGDYARAGECAARALAIARSGGLRFEECAHLHNVGESHLRAGDHARAREAVLASNEIAKDLGAEPAQLHNEVLLAYLDENVRRLEELAECFRVTQSPWHEIYARLWLGKLLAARGSVHFRAHTERALEIARDLKLRTMQEELAAELGG